MDYTTLTVAELANGISQTEAAIGRCMEILDDLQEPKNCRCAGGGRGDTQLVTEARCRFEGPYKSLQHQAQDWGSLTVKGG